MTELSESERRRQDKKLTQDMPLIGAFSFELSSVFNKIAARTSVFSDEVETIKYLAEELATRGYDFVVIPIPGAFQVLADKEIVSRFPLSYLPQPIKERGIESQYSDWLQEMHEKLDAVQVEKEGSTIHFKANKSGPTDEDILDSMNSISWPLVVTIESVLRMIEVNSVDRTE